MSSYTLAIDPGKLACGVAIFSDKTLVHATLARNVTDKPGSDGPEVWRRTAKAAQKAWYAYSYLNPHVGLFPSELPRQIVLEVPQVYRAGLQKGDQKDILALAGVDGALAALFDCPVTWYHPAKWKGQVPKDIHNKRVLGRLTDAEKKAIDPSVPKSLLNNTIDAIGLGLFYLGRMK